MNPSDKIVVTGATGSLGREVADQLNQKGFKVIAGTTDTEKKKEIRGIPTCRLVYEDPSSFSPALSGAAGLFLMAPPLDPDSDSKLIPVIDMAGKAGVRHIVFNSAIGTDMAEASPLYRIEKHLMVSGVNYTIVRPNFFMENFSTGFIAPMIAHGGIFLAAADAKTSFVSTRDIASVAVKAFENRLFGQAYTLTGPDALDHARVAAVISKGSGKTITYHPISEAEMKKGALESGMPEGSVEFMAVLYDAVRQGFTASITDDVKKITGLSPLTFEEFAKSAAGFWK